MSDEKLREMDEKIARALGEDVTPYQEPNGPLEFYGTDGRWVRRFSSDWSAMGELIEEMGKRGWDVGTRTWNTQTPFVSALIIQDGEPSFHGSADTMPEAVARAALAALTDGKEGGG